MPYWERKGGRDHIFTLSHDQVCAAVLLGAQGERWLRSSSDHTVALSHNHMCESERESVRCIRVGVFVL